MQTPSESQPEERSAIARRIQARLAIVGLSGIAAAKEAGLSPSAVNQIIAGQSESPRLDTLEKLCGPLQCSIHYLVSDEPQPVEARPRGNGGPAFPQTTLTGVMNGTGMTLRDWFAGQALSGVLASEGENITADATAVRRAFGYADAMLAERAKAVRS